MTTAIYRELVQVQGVYGNSYVDVLIVSTTVLHSKYDIEKSRKAIPKI